MAGVGRVQAGHREDEQDDVDAEPAQAGDDMGDQGRLAQPAGSRTGRARWMSVDVMSSILGIERFDV